MTDLLHRIAELIISTLSSQAAIDLLIILLAALVVAFLVCLALVAWGAVCSIFGRSK